MMNAILEYDYRASGVAAFSHYLARAINNALMPTRKQDRAYRRVEARTGRLRSRRRGGGTEPGWIERRPAPEAAAIDHELLEVVQSVIPRLPSPSSAGRAAWMIDRILTTGEWPMAREVAQLTAPARVPRTGAADHGSDREQHPPADRGRVPAAGRTGHKRLGGIQSGVQPHKGRRPTRGYGQ